MSHSPNVRNNPSEKEWIPIELYYQMFSLKQGSLKQDYMSLRSQVLGLTVRV